MGDSIRRRFYNQAGDRRHRSDEPTPDYRPPAERRYDPLGHTQHMRDEGAREAFEKRVQAGQGEGTELTPEELTLAWTVYRAGRIDGRLAQLRDLADQRRQQEGAA